MQTQAEYRAKILDAATGGDMECSCADREKPDEPKEKP